MHMFGNSDISNTWESRKSGKLPTGGGLLIFLTPGRGENCPPNATATVHLQIILTTIAADDRRLIGPQSPRFLFPTCWINLERGCI